MRRVDLDVSVRDLGKVGGRRHSRDGRIGRDKCGKGDVEDAEGVGYATWLGDSVPVWVPLSHRREKHDMTTLETPEFALQQGSTYRDDRGKCSVSDELRGTAGCGGRRPKGARCARY